MFQEQESSKYVKRPPAAKDKELIKFGVPVTQVLSDHVLQFDMQLAVKKRQYKINQNYFSHPNGFKIPTSIVMTPGGYLIEGGLDEKLVIRQKIGKVYS